MRSPRRSKLTVSILCLVLLLTSCQQMSLEEETGGSSGTSCASPVGFGEGTAERPFTVGDVMKGKAAQSQSQVWVIGYAVGSAYRSLDKATFSPFLQPPSQCRFRLHPSVTLHPCRTRFRQVAEPVCPVAAACGFPPVCDAAGRAFEVL